MNDLRRMAVIGSISLIIVLTLPKLDSTGIGEVTASDVKDLQEREIGNAQAWYYAIEKALVSWECFLGQPYRQNDLLTDSLVTTL